MNLQCINCIFHGYHFFFFLYNNIIPNFFRNRLSIKIIRLYIQIKKNILIFLKNYFVWWPKIRYTPPTSKIYIRAIFCFWSVLTKIFMDFRTQPRFPTVVIIIKRKFIENIRINYKYKYIGNMFNSVLKWTCT